jgi:predicted phosphodiesterase
MRAWDANVGGGDTQRLYYFKARVRRRSHKVVQDLNDIIETAKKAKVKKNVVDAAQEERVYWVQITDLQAGQADGDGLEGMVARALQIADLVKSDIEALSRSGRPVTSIFVPVTGDLVEGISGWYEMQTFSVTLDRRDQAKLVRRLLSEILISIGEMGLPVRVAVVPGNHGENRQNGKAYTTLGDNDDVAIVEQIAEAFALAGLNNIMFTFPEKDRLSLTLEVAGHVIGLTHGHVARYGNGVEGKILGWFKNMAATRDPIGDAELLFTGHYHHARHQQLIGDTWWIQGGALCDTSAWFSQAAGLVSDPVLMKGTITRLQVVEQVIPKSWPRSKTLSTRIGD